MGPHDDLSDLLPPLLELDDEPAPGRLSRADLEAEAGPGWTWSRPELDDGDDA
jgi:hypothetical protein